MTRKEKLAQEIFIRNLKSGFLTDTTRKFYESEVEQAFELAELFMRKEKELKKKSASDVPGETI